MDNRSPQQKEEKGWEKHVRLEAHILLRPMDRPFLLFVISIQVVSLKPSSSSSFGPNEGEEETLRHLSLGNTKISEGASRRIIQIQKLNLANWSLSVSFLNGCHNVLTAFKTFLLFFGEKGNAVYGMQGGRRDRIS